MSDTQPQITTQEPSVSDVIDEHFKSLNQGLSVMMKNTRMLQDELKHISKCIKSNNKLNKNKKKKQQAKLSLSNELKNFLSISDDIKLTKAEVMKQVSTYIKEKHLQIQEDKRKFKPNKELSKIFGIKSAKNAPNLTFVEINKYVSHHLSK
jgi:chromatin remodeling complex protein RSC6